MLSGCSNQLPESKEEEDWKPEKPITLVVPFAAGGAIDRVARTLQPFIQENLGVPVSVVNMPGGSTVLAYEDVLNSPKDGTKILCISPEVGSMAVMGQSEITPKDWEVFGITAAFPNIYVVAPDSPMNSIDDMLSAMKERKITVATAAHADAWTRPLLLLIEEVKDDYKTPEFIAQGGGYVAAQAAMKKEVDIGSCGLPEVIDLLRGKAVKALTYWGEESFEVEGYGKIPSIAEALPELKKYVPNGGWTGFAVPAGTDEKIVKKLQQAYEYAVNKEEYKQFCEENGYIYLYRPGEEAKEYTETMASVSAWILYDNGFAKISPEEFNIKRPN